VLANVRRWRASAIGRGLLPGLIGADGPRPDLVRFVFAGPVDDLPRRLSDPRLGLVSPDAIRPGAGAGPLRRVAQAGSGPFELGPRSGAAIVLRRNGGWWGSRRGLGPALDQLTFRLAATRAERLALLREGAVRVAADIGVAAARRLHGDPLLTTAAERSPHAIGLERSVRGLTGWRPGSLSGVWLAVVDDG
jgi:ABC-type transport system substrate-binding protein